jgi:hypothetical protein
MLISKNKNRIYCGLPQITSATPEHLQKRYMSTVILIPVGGGLKVGATPCPAHVQHGTIWYLPDTHLPYIFLKI